MARARNLKPSFFMNERLAEVAPIGRLLFAGLWCLADREGRLEDRPKKIKAELLPYDSCNCNDLLDDLQDGGFILRYSVEGVAYIQILRFTKHQNPHVKEHASTIPAPDSPGASTGKPGADPADSLLPLTDSLNPLTSASAKAERETVQERFDRFWDAYPKKRSKGDAFKAWLKIKPSEQLLGEMLQALERAKTSADWMKEGGQFIPYPATWLNDQGWHDDFAKLKPPELPKAPPPPRCKAPGCAGEGLYGGLCSAHYMASKPPRVAA